MHVRPKYRGRSSLQKFLLPSHRIRKSSSLLDVLIQSVNIVYRRSHIAFLHYFSIIIHHDNVQKKVTEMVVVMTSKLLGTSFIISYAANDKDDGDITKKWIHDD